ncbi:glycosyl hydrolase catalytic core-domain-containing protein [Chaetomium strumarium]|uniref:Glycosyl hydrolase catalytic core-domain-containing protein n=1 Tax=Chaetomium strumarium TaxID=1170767 RepID=A0AAJ0GUM7_9PEZI|nr:glycosyl hydrolase catalytic core-domain-containing protein [Chaetomium strumarium]
MLPCSAALVALLAALPSFVLPAAADSSSKRGLVHTPNETTRADDTIWVQKPTDLTWYYNYKPEPESAFQDIPQSEFEFVPMLWGAPASLDDTSFLSTVRSLIEDKKINITHVLSFNEPDGPFAYGGSNMEPADAAQVWVKNMIPLQQMGIRVGLPACTGGPGGIPWLQNFLSECSKLVSTGDKTQNCTYDFVTIHWYGNFEGLASHMGQYSATFPNKTMWITEYNIDNQDLQTTQAFFNMSADYFDRLDFVERYSYFGAFRSDVSNVGPNGAMLSADGNLTDIGAWYLGRQATGVQPSQGESWGFRSAVPHASVALLSAWLIMLLVGV